MTLHDDIEQAIAEGRALLTGAGLGDEDLIPDSWTLGQCVYEMSTGKRCQKQATIVLKIGHVAMKDDAWKAYGYCRDHHWSVTEPRDPRLHKTAKPLTRVEKDEA